VCNDVAWALQVANEAVLKAQRDGIDVVLVDTAGRMQDNEPLMRSLSSLIHLNQPNLVSAAARHTGTQP
jgi:signal recognition particle receptor subunit alpha